jgi:para-aminobenzoate synthetase
MITDLMRNDLARFCRSGTVTVKRPRALTTLPGIYHTYAEITGHRKSSVPELEAIVKSLPCGSISGCPKHAAVKLIGRLEPRPRGIFCGTLGQFTDAGLTTLSVLIRTIVWQPGRLWYQAGSGITIASVREDESAEIIAKCRPAFTLGKS